MLQKGGVVCMQKRCENCGNILSETERACPICGIPTGASAKPLSDESDGGDLIVRSSNPAVRRKRYVTLSTVIMVVLAIALLIAALSTCVGGSGFFEKPKEYSRDLGYYNYNDTYFYNQDGSWYQYDEALGWILADPSDDFLDHYDSYYEGRINGESGVSDFRDSEYYDPQAGLVERSDNSGGGVDNGGNDNNDLDNDADW